MDVMVMMCTILATMFAGLALLYTQLEQAKDPGTWLAPPTNPTKRACEVWFLGYAVFWISCFAVIIGAQLYEPLDARQARRERARVGQPQLVVEQVAHLGTRRIHGVYTVVTWRLRGGHTTVTVRLNISYTAVTRRSHGGHTPDTM